MDDLDRDEEQRLAANIGWLASADPDDWHRVALDFNWGEPLYLLDWIVRQPNCDIATALTLFWKGEPAAWLDEEGASEEEPDGFSYLNRQICAYIANRVKTGGYTRSEIAFTPTTWTKKDYVDLEASAQALTQPNIPVHPDLIRVRAGRVVELDADFYSRYPEEFHLSYFDEQLSDDLEQGRYETPESIATMQAVDEIEQKTLQSLPAWLRGDDNPGETQINAEEADAMPAPEPDSSEHVEEEPVVEVMEEVSQNPPANDASARVRAMRQQARLEAADSPDAKSASGFSAWLRRLFKR